MNVPVMAACVPGVESIEMLDANTYRGVFKVSVGPISARFDGRVDIVETDEASYHASLKATGLDNRIASRVTAQMTMLLSELSATSSEMLVKADVNLMGKLGEFGRPILIRKANDLMEQFSGRLKKALERFEAPTEAPE